MTTCNWTLPKTEQEVFDIVATGLLRQNRKSTDGFGGCFYRGQDSCKCAAGLLVPDEYYHSGLEGRSWQKLIEKGVVPSQHGALIARLQVIHDSLNTEQWRHALIEFAAECGLNDAVCYESTEDPTQ
jgi:hypothetical protein